MSRSAKAELHTTHGPLLDRNPKPAGQRAVDAVVVPASRAAGTTTLHAARLAADLGCPLILVCSMSAIPDDVVRLTRETGAEVYAVDMGKGSHLPPMRTSAIRWRLPGHPAPDTSQKRNLGLAVAHMAGRHNVLFLDDDIVDVPAGEVEQAASLLGDFDVVGLRNTGFPDNSVVHHAHRDTGGFQDTFIGGGAMLVSRAWMTSLFPDTYNEDWLFLIGADGFARCAEFGTFAQETFDPYRSATRARIQEFGDCIAEGLFAVLDQKVPLDAANRPFWKEFLATRETFILDIVNRLDRTAGARHSSMLAALKGAHEVVQAIDADMCRRFVAAWKLDRFDWVDFLHRQPTGVSVERALTILGTGFRTH